jgi:hypothetical protein
LPLTVTALFLELLVVGTQALIWIIWLGLSAGSWHGSPNTAESLGAWVPLIGIAALIAAYTLGVTVDRLADTLEGSLDHYILDIRRGQASTRITVLQGGFPAMTGWLDYMRGRRRIARGTVVNVLVADSAWVIAHHFGAHAIFVPALPTLCIASIIGILALYADISIGLTYTHRMDLATGRHPAWVRPYHAIFGVRSED